MNTNLTREQAMEQYGMSDDFIQAVINTEGTLEMAIGIWEVNKDIMMEKFDKMMADGCEGEYLAWKGIIADGAPPTPQPTTPQLERANRVSIQVAGDGFKAIFWRTHKKISEIVSTDTTFDTSSLKDMNNTAKREAYRVWICEHSAEYGIKYDPSDNRSDGNTFPSKYTSDELVMEWSQKIVAGDIQEWVNKVADEYKAVLAIGAITAESPMEIVNRNGKMVNPKYNNGNWSYATVDVTTTVQVIDGENINEGYVTMMVELVSGQMKKPTKINEGGYTYTGFKEELLKDIKGFLPVKDEPKADNKKSKDDTKPTEAVSNSDKSDETVPPVAEPKKKTRSKKSKDGTVTPKASTGERKITKTEKSRLAKKSEGDQ